MRKKHKNEIYKVLLSYGLNLNEFSLEEEVDEHHQITTINHVSTGFQFYIRNPISSYYDFDYAYVEFSPILETSDFLPTKGYAQFDDIVHSIEKWIENHLKEFFEDRDEVDLWSEYQTNTKSLEFENISFANKEFFTIDEKKQVKMALNELKLLYQKSFNTEQAEQNIIEERLDYLIDATERLNKFDWKSLVLSTLFSITVALSFNTDQGKLLFELFKKVILHIQTLSQ